MSRPRVVDGVDARGRPRTRWADAPELDAPRYGHMEPANPPGVIERRYVEPQAASARAVPAVSHAERMRQSRLNGVRRHVEVVTAGKRKEGPTMPDHVRTPPDGEERSVFADIARAAAVAEDARQEFARAVGLASVAADAYDAAVGDLATTWGRLRTEATPGAVWTALEAQTGFVEGVRDGEDQIASGESVPFSAIRTVKPSRPAKRHRSSSTEDQEKDERARAVVDAIDRHGGDRRAAAAELGMKLNAVSMVAKHAAARLGP